MAKTRKKSILSLLSSASGRVGRGASDYISDTIGRQIQAKLDPRNLARFLGGKGLLGDAAVALTSGLINLNKGSLSLGRKRNKNPQYSSIGNGPIRPLRMGDASADILAKMYNFMRKTDELAVRSREIENAFRQEQIDEDERRHQELVKAIKAFTKNRGGQQTNNTSNAGGGLSDIVKEILKFEGGKRILGNVGARLFKGLGNRLGKLGKGLLPKRVTKLFEPKAPPVEPVNVNEPIREKITTEKGNRVRPTRGSAEAKSTLKARRASRGVPTKETEKSLSRIQKAGKALKSGGKTAVRISSKALGAGKSMLKFLFSVPGLSTVINLALLKNQIDGITEEYTSGKIDEKEYHRRIVEAVGGSLGALGGGVAGGEILGLIGSIFGGPVGATLGGIIGAVGGSLIGGAYGEDAANALYKFFEENDEKTIEEKLRKITQLPSISSNSFEQKLMANANQSRGQVTTANVNQPTAKVIAKSPTVPTIQTAMNMESSQPIVSVNNKVTNIGGQPSKVLNVATAKQRNSDLDKFLKTTVVPV